MARAPHPLVLAAIALAGVALCGFSIHVATNEGVPDIQVALLQWISIPYIAAGLIAWWRRPESRLGPLMIGVGFSTGLLCLQFVDNTPLWSIGAFFDIFAAAAFIHVTLAFPTGRLRSTRERVLVVRRLRDRARPPGRQADVPGRHPAERLRRERRLRHVPDDRARPALQHRRHLPRGRGDAAGAVGRHRAARTHLADGAGRLLRPGPRRALAALHLRRVRLAGLRGGPAHRPRHHRLHADPVPHRGARRPPGPQRGERPRRPAPRQPGRRRAPGRAGPRAARPHAAARLLAPRVRQLRRRRRPRGGAARVRRRARDDPHPARRRAGRGAPARPLASRTSAS